MRPRDLIEDLSRNSSSPQWEPRNEDDSVALTIIHYVIPLPISKAVAVLHGNDRNNPACSFNVFLRHIRQGHEPDLPFAFELRQRSHRVLERYDWIGVVQLIDVNPLQAQPF